MVLYLSFLLQIFSLAYIKERKKKAREYLMKRKIKNKTKEDFLRKWKKNKIIKENEIISEFFKVIK